MAFAGIGARMRGAVAELGVKATSPGGARDELPARILLPRLVFIATVVVLLAFGLTMLYSASSIEGLYGGEDTNGDPAYFLKRQLIALAIGLVCCIVLAFMRVESWSGAWGYAIVAVLILLLVITLLTGVGDTDNGARRWIDIPVMGTLQASEFAKVAVILVASGLQVRLVEGAVTRGRYLVGIIYAVILPLGLIVCQPDLGTTVIAFVAYFVILWMGGMPFSLFKWIVMAAVVLLIAAVIVEPYRLTRVLVLLGIETSSIQDDSYQVTNSLYAISGGGVFGLGLGNSKQKFFYLPESKTDFIFAIVGEELGLVGCLAVVALFVVLMVSGLQIAKNAASEYGRLVAASCSITICFQAFLNILQTIGIAPVVGKTLPFFSYGSNSLIAVMMMVGLVLSVSFHSGARASVEERRNRLRVLTGGKG